MDGPGKIIWLRVHAECALLRASHRRWVASDLDFVALEQDGVSDPIAYLEHLNRHNTPEQLNADLRSLEQAEDVLACFAVAHGSELEPAAAAAIVCAMTASEKAAVIRAQDELNSMELLASIAGPALSGEYLRRLAGVEDGAE